MSHPSNRETRTNPKEARRQHLEDNQEEAAKPQSWAHWERAGTVPFTWECPRAEHSLEPRNSRQHLSKACQQEERGRHSQPGTCWVKARLSLKVTLLIQKLWLTNHLARPSVNYPLSPCRSGSYQPSPWDHKMKGPLGSSPGYGYGKEILSGQNAGYFAEKFSKRFSHMCSLWCCGKHMGIRDAGIECYESPWTTRGSTFSSRKFTGRSSFFFLCEPELFDVKGLSGNLA